MNLTRLHGLKKLPHEVIVDGSQSFFDKVRPEDYEVSYYVGHPYPVTKPCRYLNRNKIINFWNSFHPRRKNNTKYREFKKFQKDIFEQKLDERLYAYLPNFFIDYMDDNCPETDFEWYHYSNSQGLLEQLVLKGENYFIKPTINNKLDICKIEDPTETKVLRHNGMPSLLNIENMGNEHANRLILRARNSIELIEVDDNFTVFSKITLNSNIGYLDSKLNKRKKDELAIIDTRNKIKLFNLSLKQVTSSYESLSLTNSAHLEYISENILLMMTDKELKIFDTRIQDSALDVNINLEECDTLLKLNGCDNNVYIASKHCYYIYDIRTTFVDEYIHHNLKYPPRHINSLTNENGTFVTLFSQSNEGVIFGRMSPYGIPFHPFTLNDTFMLCKTQIKVPIIPHIETRLNSPLSGVQLIPNENGFTIYFSNILHEIFKQDVTLKSSPFSDIAVDRFYHWLEDLCQENNEPLNAVHLANASSAFNLEQEIAELDLFKAYETCDGARSYLESDKFDHEKYNAEEFDGIWDIDIIDEDPVDGSDSETARSKVEKWIEQHAFSKDND